MNDFAIGIIGGTGGIGKWFADFFTGEGHRVLVSGRTNDYLTEKRMQNQV